MAFVAKFDGTYWDADVSSQLSFDSPWCHNQAAEDDVANDMHNTAVQEFVDKLKAGRLTIAVVKEGSED